METATGLRALTLGLVLGLGAQQAAAGLELCNGTNVRHSVAIGYKSGETWVSEGWWNIEPGACATPVGGELKLRFYYFRAEAAGHAFVDEDYAFCTQSAAFTIEGDETCAARGYEQKMFRQIDTGEARHFTYTFGPSVSPASSPAPQDQPGQWGEPYFSATAIFQECAIGGGMPQCSFHADGTKFYVYDEGRTPEGIMAALRGYLPGTPIEVSGDLEAVYDTSAEVVLRGLRPRAYNRWDSMLRMMQGSWTDPNDIDTQFDITGSEMETSYQGKFLGREYLSMSDSCEGMTGQDFLLRREEESGDIYCFTFQELSEERFVLTYLPRGNSHYFVRLD